MKKKGYMKTLSEQIREWRKKRGLTQEELAEKIGVAMNTVSRWEIGQSYPHRRFIQDMINMGVVK